MVLRTWTDLRCTEFLLSRCRASLFHGQSMDGTFHHITSHFANFRPTYNV